MGADAGAVAAGVSLSLATDGGNLELPDVAELPDIGNSFSVALELDPETGNLEGGVSARDFLSVAQNLAMVFSRLPRVPPLGARGFSMWINTALLCEMHDADVV